MQINYQVKIKWLF